MKLNNIRNNHDFWDLLALLYTTVQSLYDRIRIKVNTIVFFLKYKKIFKVVEGAIGVKIYQKVIIKGKGKVKIGKMYSLVSKMHLPLKDILS